MTSLIIHAVLGVLVVGFTMRSNPAIFRGATPALSGLEALYYIIGIASIPLCWYFNYRYVVEYGAASTNPFVGPGSWMEFIGLGYANPASSSASADYTIANVLLLPLFTIVDGRHSTLADSGAPNRCSNASRTAKKSPIGTVTSWPSALDATSSAPASIAASNIASSLATVAG